MTTESTDIRSHFALAATPFTREIPVGRRWTAPFLDEPLEALRRTIELRMSAVLIAPSGTGKTMLLRTLCEGLPEARYRVHSVKVTSLSKRDMCREIATALGLEPIGTFPRLVRALQEHVDTTLQQDGLRPVLVIDEGHDMRPEVLAILRILTNFDMDSRLVLSLVIAGEPGLRRLLERHDLEPVRARMAHCATLRLLSRAETRDYVEHRLRSAGADSIPFDDLAFDAIFEIGRGNLRATDHLCRKAMEIAALRGTSTLDAPLFAEARQQLMI